MKSVMVAANWKMNKGPTETEEFLLQFLKLIPQVDHKHYVFFAPAYCLPAFSERLKYNDIGWGAQNCYFEESGAFTGELSPRVLSEMGSSFGLVGHSERRSLFSETDQDVAKKVKALQSCEITPMVCVGESLSERKEGRTDEVISEQLSAAMDACDISKGLVVAYEPVWAIGTGEVATPQQAADAHKTLRDLLVAKFGEAGTKTKILYGGSVKPENAAELAKQPNVDGFLVGGASLKIDSLIAIHDAAIAAE